MKPALDTKNRRVKRIRLNEMPQNEDEADEWFRAIEENNTNNYDVRIYNEVKEYVKLLKEYSYNKVIAKREDAKSCWKRDHELPEDFPISITSICEGPFEFEYKITVGVNDVHDGHKDDGYKDDGSKNGGDTVTGMSQSLTAQVTQTNFYTVDSVMIEGGLALEDLDMTIPAHKALHDIVKDMWNAYETFAVL